VAVVIASLDGLHARLDRLELACREEGPAQLRDEDFREAQEAIVMPAPRRRGRPVGSPE
jgi:hypothetical protein